MGFHFFYSFPSFTRKANTGFATPNHLEQVRDFPNSEWIPKSREQCESSVDC